MDLTKPSTRQNLLLGLLLLAALLRIPDLGSKSIWGDEATSIFVSLGITTANDHPPGYYILGGLPAKIFGLGEFQIRIVSAICGILLVWGIFLLGQTLARLWKSVPPMLGVIAALMVALSPYYIQLSQEGRPYSMIAAIAAWSSYLFLRILEMKGALGEITPGFDKGFWLTTVSYILITTLGLYTHYFTWLVLVVQSIFWLYVFLFTPAKRKILFQLLPALVLVVILFLPNLPRVLHLVGARESGIEASRNLMGLNYFITSMSTSIFRFATGYYFFGGNVSEAFQSISVRTTLLVLFCGLPGMIFLSGIWDILKKSLKFAQWGPFVYLLLGLLITLAGALAIDASIARQHSIAAVFFFLVFAWGLLALPRTARFLAAVGFSIILLISLVSYYRMDTHPFYLTNWRDASAFVKQQHKPGDVIYVSYAEREGYYSLKAYEVEGDIVYAMRPGLPEKQDTWLNPATGKRYPQEYIINKLLERADRVIFIHPDVSQGQQEQLSSPHFVITDSRLFGLDLEVCLIQKTPAANP